MKAANMTYGRSAGRTCGIPEVQLQTRQPGPSRNRDAQCTMHNVHQFGAQELTETRLYATEERNQVLLGLLMVLFRASLVLPADASDAF